MDQNPQNSRRARYSNNAKPPRQPLEPNFSRNPRGGRGKLIWTLIAIAALLIAMAIPLYGYLKNNGGADKSTQIATSSSSSSSVAKSSSSTSSSTAESSSSEAASSQAASSSAVSSSSSAMSSSSSAASSSSDTPASGSTYTVQAGQGWYRISVNTGVPVATLQALNPGVTLSPGVVLKTQ